MEKDCRTNDLKGSGCDNRDHDGANKAGESLKNISEMSLWSYLSTELLRGYQLDYDEARFTEKRERVYMVMRIPKELEKMMVYGFFLSLDAFLFVVSLLPLRILVALFHLMTKPCKNSGRWLEPAQVCDLLKCALVVASSWLLTFVDISILYHMVRGQAVIKLYLLFNMLDIADKLFSAFGQDILDSLSWTATEQCRNKTQHLGVLPHFALAVIYVVSHTMLILLQATTLNVAFNSHNKALLLIMMSNNFVELKGCVFKKFEKNNLFQMSCSDVRERFHLLILLSIVCHRNMTEFSWNPEYLWELIPDALIVLMAEVVVDWVKHAFIARFNEIPISVYGEYIMCMAQDLVNTRKKKAFSDHCDVLSRRMGFTPLPLVCLLFRVFGSMFKMTNPWAWLCVFCLYISSLVFKIINGFFLVRACCHFVNKHSKDKDPDVSSSSKIKPEHTSSTSSPVRKRVKLLEPENISANTVQMITKDGKLIIDNNSDIATDEQHYEDEIVDPGLTLKDTGSPHASLINRKRSLSEIDRYTLCSNRIV